jgi:hypothetical protein
MALHRLQPHPAAPPKAVTAVSCAVTRQGPAGWELQFEVNDPSGALSLPEARQPRRTDGLWKATCFELFLRREGEGGYFEFNLSPSGEWAAYAFDGYRQGMADLDIAAPPVDMATTDGMSRLGTFVTAPGPGPWRASLSAVIEEADGAKSYWALAHASDKPDFHHPDSFVLELP